MKTRVSSKWWVAGSNYKLQATCYRLIAIFFSMLIITTPFSSALLDWEEEEREAQTGESIVVNVKGYEPQILPTSVVEDGDVPIYVYLTGTTPGTILNSQSNAEPIYGSMDIKQVYIRPEDEETLEYVRGSPKYIKPRQVSLENLGYLIVTLKQIDKEADVPDEIKLNMKAEITFENAERLYSMIEQDLLLPERSDEAAWRQDENFNDYQFFAGRGAIRATSIGDGSAELTVYGGQDLQWPFTGTPRPLEDLELNEGETSDPIRMSAASDFMTNAFRVKLTDIIDSAKERARIRVNVNGDEKEYIVTEGSRLYPGSSLTVTEINVVRNTRTSRVTYEIVVRGPRDTSRVSKTFFERIAGGAAGILDYASETDAETGSSGGAVSSAAGTGGASFIIMSDMHTIAGTNAGIRTKAVEAVKRINPPFVILTGDIVGGEPTKYNQDGTIKSEGTTKPQADAMWSLFERETGKPLRDAGIEMFAIPGNHDLDTNALTEAYTHYWDSHKPATPVSGKYPLYYSFDYGSQHFVMLKANRRDLGAEQTSWLEEDLRKAKQEGKASLVFSHYSLEAMKKACPGGTGQSDELANNAELKTLFRENNVAAFFHGDVHFFYEGTTDGVNVVAVGPLGSKQCKIPETETDAPYMVVVANANGMNVETYGLKYPDYTERFDESLFSDNVPGYTAWRQGEVSAQAGAASTSENACDSIDGICATRCEDGRERTDSVAANNRCNEGASPAGSMMCCIPSEADASTAETQNTCEIAATDREKVGTCRSNEESCKQGEVKTVGAFSLGGERADVTCGDAGLQCCMTKVNAETSTCEEAASSKGKTGTCRTVDESCKQGETKTVGAFSLGGERADVTCGDAGLQCCMTKVNAETSTCEEAASSKGKTGTCRTIDESCRQNEIRTTGAVGIGGQRTDVTCGNSGLQCCITTIGDESCTVHGGECADKREFDCYTNAEYTQTRDFERLKCMSRPSDSNYVCCPSGFVKEKEVVSSDETSEEISPAPRTAAPTIAAGAGEGICKNKVLVFREGDTPEQWLEIIKSSTQEMVYCTAAEEFKRVAELYFGIKDEKGALYEDRANFKLGEIYYWLGDTETALKYFRLAIKNNIGEFIPLAKSRITELEEDAALHTRHKIGEFEDNGVSIRVMVLDMPFQNEEQPSATIEVEAEGTKKLNVGNGLFSRDITETGEDDVSRQYNWLVRDISSESVIIEKKYRAAPPRGYRALVKALPLNSDVRLDYGSSYRTAKLKSVDLKKYAIVTVIPGTGAPLVSNTNFSIHIPIEKRAIQWTPDEISDKINSTQAAIEDLDEVITTLSDVVTVWKKVCLVTFAYLTLKNSFFSGMSRTQARRLAMHGPDGTSGWDAYCRQNSGEGSMYEDYNECVIDNSDAIEATIDESQDAVETVNDEMENYRDQPWYRNLTKDYADLQQYEDYMGDDLYSPEQLRDYRYWQLMRQSSEYTSLNGEPSGEGYEYNLRSEVDSRISSMRLENTDKLDAYLGAVSDIDAHYENFGTLSEQDKSILFSDLYESHLAEPDARSGDFPLIETIGVTPLSTIRREGRQLYSNTPHGRIILQEATVANYQEGLADATSTESPRYLEGMTPELKEQFTEESQRVEAAYEGNPNAPLRTNQGNVYVDGEGRLYVAMTTAYSTAEQNPTYSPQATAEFYPDGKPYCIPSGNGNYVKVLDFYQDGSPSVIQQWNIGTDGLLCTDDDILVQHQSMLERPESESLHRRLVEEASRVGRHSEGQVLSIGGRDFGVSTSRANTDASRSSATCYDVMDPDDCRMLFGVCDPVMCPPSRFNLGGAWQVNDVVQTGLIGSIVLGLHNFDIPYEPVPICLTGVLAGLQNIKSVLRGYVECLKTAQVQGVSVGICDKIRSVFICELIWKEAMAIINMKGGIFNWISQTFMGEEQGGGEYLTFESSIQNVEDSVSFFTSEYATSAFASYESRSTAEIGTEICKQAIFGKVPAFGEFFDELAQPESPPQYTAIVDQTGYSETQQLTRYGVFYHIYAGEDNPATYSVFLKNSITNDVHYATERCEGRQGSIEKGGIASFNLDCIAPNGYDNVCITLNGNTECGFGKVSTDFALDYLSDMIVQDEALRQIESEEDCIASTPRTSPTLGSIPLPSSSGLLSSGVQRVCSLPNPGQGTNPTDWREVGTCGKDSTGRSMGKCWIDMRTVSINDADRMKEVSDALDETGFRSLREEMGIDVLEYEESMEELRSIEKIGTDTCDGMTNAMSAYKYLETRTITPKISAEAGYKYAELMDKAARDCAQKDPKREFTRLLDRFEYDLEALYFIFLDEFEADVAPYMASSELPADFVKEYQQKVKELYDIYKNNLTELRSTLAVDEGVYSQYSENFETLYNTANSMQEPFVFKVEVSEEELSQQAQIEENKCNECSSGIRGVICRKPACHEKGSCYVEYTVGDALGELGTLNKCHACAKLTSCSQLKDDKDMCNNQACTDMAKNGEGMSCAYRVVNGQAQCVEAERMATSTTEEESTGPVQGACPQVTTLSCDDPKAKVNDISKVDMTNNIKPKNDDIGTVDIVRNGINKELIPLYKEVAGNRLPWEMLAALHLREGGAREGASILNGGPLCNNNDGSRCSACNDGATLKNDLECGTRLLLQKVDKTKIEANDIETIKLAFGKYGGVYRPCTDVSYQVTAFFDEYHSNMWKAGLDCVGMNCKEDCVTDATLTTGRQPTGCCSIKVYNKGQEPAGFSIAGGQSHCNSNQLSKCITERGEQNGGQYSVYSYKSCTMRSTAEPCGTIIKQNLLGVFTMYAILKQLQRTDASFGGAAGTSTASSTGSTSSSEPSTTATSGGCISAGGTCKAGCTERYENQISNSCATGVCCRPNAREGVTPNTETKRVGAIGDSITQNGGYVNYLNTQCKTENIDFFEHGSSGEGSTAIARRFDRVILTNNYNDVIIMAGVNNICGGSETVKRDLQAMYKKAKDAGLSVIALTITPWKGTTGTYGWTTACQRNQEEVNNWIMTESNADVKVDVYSILNDPANPGTMKTAYHAAGQFLHPNAAGQEAIGNAIKDAAYPECRA